MHTRGGISERRWKRGLHPKYTQGEGDSEKSVEMEADVRQMVDSPESAHIRVRWPRRANLARIRAESWVMVDSRKWTRRARTARLRASQEDSACGEPSPSPPNSDPSRSRRVHPIFRSTTYPQTLRVRVSEGITKALNHINPILNIAKILTIEHTHTG